MQPVLETAFELANLIEFQVSYSKLLEVKSPIYSKLRKWVFKFDCLKNICVKTVTFVKEWNKQKNSKSILETSVQFLEDNILTSGFEDFEVSHLVTEMNFICFQIHYFESPSPEVYTLTKWLQSLTQSNQKIIPVSQNPLP